VGGKLFLLRSNIYNWKNQRVIRKNCCIIIYACYYERTKGEEEAVVKSIEGCT